MRKTKVLIINSGGTLGMVETGNGYVPNKNLLNEMIGSSGEFVHHELPTFDLVHCERVVDSSSMNYELWNHIIDLIANNYAKYDGFLVLHGTDTMCYTAAALSFALTGLTKPVILTGSQIPLVGLRNDAKTNFIHALLFAANPKIKEVCVYFGHELFRGNRSFKYSSDDFMAFRTPNYPVLADVGVKILLHEQYLLKPASEQVQFVAQHYKKTAVTVLTLYPNFYVSLLNAAANDANCQAVILLAFGKGTVPSEDPEFVKGVQAIQASGKLLIVCSQCPQGAIDLQCYQASNFLLGERVLSAGDMTTEACITKTQYLLARNMDTSGNIDYAAFIAGFNGDLAGER